MPRNTQLVNDGLDREKGERLITFNLHGPISLPFLLRECCEHCKEGQDGTHPCKCVWPFCLISIRQGLVSWLWEDLTYEIQPWAKSKPQLSEVCLSRARSELWQGCSREPYAAWARPCLASVLPLPSWSPKSHCYLKRSVRKDFSFPDRWQMFAQIYFGGISSTLLSFLPKELEEHFKNTFISLSFYPSVAPGTLPLLLSFCPSFFLDLLGCNMDFICCGMEKGRCDPGGVVSAARLPLGFLAVHLHCNLEQLYLL